MKALTITCAVVLIVLGSLSWLTPFPGGTPAIAVGLAMLIWSSERAAAAILSWRHAYRRLNRALTWIENISPAPLSDTLRRTRP